MAAKRKAATPARTGTKPSMPRGVGPLRRGGAPPRAAPYRAKPAKPAKAPSKAPPGKPASAKPAPAAPAGGQAARLAALARLARDEQDTDVANVPLAGRRHGGALRAAGEEAGEGLVVRRVGGGLQLPPELAPAAPAPPTPRVAADGPVVVAGGTKTVQKVELDGGLQVVAKGASKFSLADLEVLKRVISVKGSGSIVEGINLDTLRYDAEGCVPVVAQDRLTGQVLTVGWANKEALEQSLRTKTMAYWNKATNKLQVRGEETGSSQTLVKMMVDCDNDAMLAIVEQDGMACHRETSTCWSDGRAPFTATYLGELDRIVGHLARRPPKGTEFAELIGDPVKALKRIVDDTKRLVDSLRGARDELEPDAADLLYHILIGLRARGVSLDKVLARLRQRTEDLQQAK